MLDNQRQHLIDQFTLSYYWGDDWIQKYGSYPEMSRYSDVQLREFNELKEFVEQIVRISLADPRDIFYRLGYPNSFDFEKMVANGEIEPVCTCDCHKHAPQNEHCSLC